jgi:hypothetical protein
MEAHPLSPGDILLGSGFTVWNSYRDTTSQCYGQLQRPSNHAQPEQARGPANPDKRAAMIRVSTSRCATPVRL